MWYHYAQDDGCHGAVINGGFIRGDKTYPIGTKLTVRDIMHEVRTYNEHEHMDSTCHYGHFICCSVMERNVMERNVMEMSWKISYQVISWKCHENVMSCRLLHMSYISFHLNVLHFFFPSLDVIC